MNTKEKNELIAKFMGYKTIADGRYEMYIGPFTKGTYKYGYNLYLYLDGNSMDFHVSWNWLMPVVRGLVEMAIHEDGWEAFESEYYTSLLDTVPSAVIEDVFKVVVEFIEWINKNE
jgi:hypothetical protein